MEFFEHKPTDYIHIHRLGPKIAQQKYDIHLLDEINEMTDEGIKLRYDIDINGGPLDTFAYTEFLQSVCGLKVGFANKFEEIKRISVCMNNHENSKYNQQYLDFIIERIKAKYISYRHLSEKKFDCIIFLPGSNLLKESTDLSKIKTLIMNNNAYIKPHPLTNVDDLKFLKNEFKNRVLSQKVDAIDLLHHTKSVGITGTSELFVYSVLLNKIIHDITDNNHNQHKGGYQFLFQNVIKLHPLKRKNAILNMISHKNSGIFLPVDFQQKNLREYINYLKEEGVNIEWRK